MRWDQVLALPVFIINLDRRYTERYDECLRRVKAAGFTDVRRWQAVDATTEDLQAHWAQHGSPALNPVDEEFCVSYKGKQGCFLSHVHLLKYALTEGIERFIVFEDDVLFHPEWDIYAPLFWESSLTGAPDLVYFGSQIELPPTGQRVVSAPCFCTHAMLYTNLTGIRKIYEALINIPGGVRTIDCCLIDYEWSMVRAPYFKVFNWVCWDSRGIPCEIGTNPGWTKRNCGLVFQDEAYGSDVRPWP